MKNIKQFSNVLFIVAIIFSIFTLIKVYLIRSNLPEGACPVVEYNNLIYISIGLLVLSFVVSVIIEKNDKKN